MPILASAAASPSDHQKTGFTGLFYSRDDGGRIGSGQQNPFCTIGDACLDRLYLSFMVAVDLTSKRLQLHAKLLGLGGGALLHFHEERVCVGFGDQTDGGRVATRHRRTSQRKCGNRRSQQKFFHEFLPKKIHSGLVPDATKPEPIPGARQ